MSELKYFLDRDHARVVAQSVAIYLRAEPGSAGAIFATYERKCKVGSWPTHYVGVVECGPVSVKCMGPDRFDAQFCDSKNNVTGVRGSEWIEAVNGLMAQLKLQRDSIIAGISTLAGQH